MPACIVAAGVVARGQVPGGDVPVGAVPVGVVPVGVVAGTVGDVAVGLPVREVVGRANAVCPGDVVLVPCLMRAHDAVPVALPAGVPGAVPGMVVAVVPDDVRVVGGVLTAAVMARVPGVALAGCAALAVVPCVSATADVPVVSAAGVVASVVMLLAVGAAAGLM